MALSIWGLWILLITPVYSEYHFRHPPPQSDADNPVYEMGSDIRIEWEATDGENEELSLLMGYSGRQNQPTGVFRNIKNTSYWDWTFPEVGVSSMDTHSFHLLIGPDYKPGISSHSFYLKKRGATTSMSTIPLASTSTEMTSTETTSTAMTSTLITTSTTTTTPTESSLPSDYFPNDDKWTTGGKAAVGIAVSVTVLAAAVVGYFGGRRYRQKKKRIPPPVIVQPEEETRPDPQPNQGDVRYTLPEELPDTSQPWSSMTALPGPK